MKEDTGVTCVQAKEHQKLLAGTRSKKHGKDFLTEPPKGTKPDHGHLDFKLLVSRTVRE